MSQPPVEVSSGNPSLTLVIRLQQFIAVTETQGQLTFPYGSMKKRVWKKSNGDSFVVQLLSRVGLFATPWAKAPQASLASLSFTISWSLLRLMSIELVMPSNYLILCCPLLLLPSIFPCIRVFSKRQLFASGGQSTGVSASASVLPVNIQGWFPLQLMSLFSLLSNRLSRAFSSCTASVLWHSVFFTV